MDDKDLINFMHFVVTCQKSSLRQIMEKQISDYKKYASVLLCLFLQIIKIDSLINDSPLSNYSTKGWCITRRISSCRKSHSYRMCKCVNASRSALLGIV